MIQEAQDLLREAQELIEDAIDGTRGESNTRAYLVDHLRALIDNQHGFCTSRKTLEDVMDELENEIED